MQMNKKALVGLLILLVIMVPLVWLLSTYHVVEFTLYPKNTTELDLRGEEISVTHYEKLREKLPEAEIRWDVPFQGSVLAEETTELTVSELTVEDAQILARFLPRLRKVNAEACKDYDALLALKQQRPAVQVKYRVELNGKNFASTSIQVTLDGITEEEIGMLRYLPALDAVTVTGGEPEQLKQLRTYCEEAQLRFRMQIGGEIIAEDTSAATLTGVTGEELNLLQLLPNLKKLHLVEPKADARSVIGLQETLPGVAVTWEKSILGKFYSQDAVEIDLTDMISLGEGEKPGDKTAYQYGLELPVQGTQEEVATAIKISKYHPLPDKTDVTRDLIAEVEEAMAYFPDVEQVVMLGSILHNVHMSDFRDAHRQDYKVVWSVRCGNVLTRTDAKFFMPVKYHVYYLTDTEAYNLRYLEEAVAVDIGHMNVSDISFVEYMPDLEYLILAHTSIQYIEPIRSCKKLKFLEVDWTGIRDLTPLQDCTALEDLNVGNTSVNLEPLKKMTWLKNLWAIFRGGSVYPVSQALPNTKVVASGNATVASGWRDLPNYYAMRDWLKMYYMSW